MRINWRLRIMNRTTLAALAAAVVAFVYQILAIVGVVPPVAQSDVINAVGVILTILASLGIVADPTTAGLSDSSRALGYDRPVASSGQVPEDER